MNVSECRGLCPSCLKKVGEETELCPVCRSLLSAENQSHQLSVGSALGGKYYVGRAMEESAQSITYIGLDLMKNQRVTIKEYYPKKNALRQADGYTVVPDESRNGAYSGYSFENGRAQFAKGIGNLAFFRRCKGIVALLEDFEENGTVYKVMEYGEGAPLSRVCEKKGVAFLADELLMLLEPIFMAVNAFNEACIVHGGINPDHIIVTEEGARLLDFADETFCGEDHARNSYLAPEQIFRGSAEVDEQADLYALAAVFYRGITGIPPLNARNRKGGDNLRFPTELNKRISVQTEYAVLKGLSLNPKKRYKQASQFYDDLVGAALKPVSIENRPPLL